MKEQTVKDMDSNEISNSLNNFLTMLVAQLIVAEHPYGEGWSISWLIHGTFKEDVIHSTYLNQPRSCFRKMLFNFDNCKLANFLCWNCLRWRLDLVRFCRRCKPWLMRSFKEYCICAHPHCIKRLHLLDTISLSFQVPRTSWKHCYRSNSVMPFLFFILHLSTGGYVSWQE